MEKIVAIAGGVVAVVAVIAGIIYETKRKNDSPSYSIAGPVPSSTGNSMYDTRIKGGKKSRKKKN